jgi:SAM-dependent methyltransferase
MIWILILALGFLVGFVVLFGPPYVPTMRRNMDTAFDLLDLKPGQTLLDLGSGDGRVLIAAGKRGINAVGVELSPVLAALSWLRTRRFGGKVRIIWGNYFTAKWPPADAIFTFMIPRQMAKLDRRVEVWRKGRPVKLASFAFDIPGKKSKAARNSIFLYEYK